MSNNDGSRLLFTIGSQRLDDSCWDMSDKAFLSALEAARKGGLSQASVRPVGDAIMQRFANEGVGIDSAYFILHEGGPNKAERHVHWVIRAREKRSLSVWSKCIGVKENFVEKPDRGRFSYLNSLAYLTHSKSPDKERYSPTNVYTAAGKDYGEVFRENERDWSRYSAKRLASLARQEKEYLVSSILRGKATPSDIRKRDIELYNENKIALEEAYKTYVQSKHDEYIREKESGGFSVSAIYIRGHSGAGKTRFAIDLINLLGDWSEREFGRRWEAYFAPPKNSFDEYCGQEIVLLDDSEGSMLTPQEWKLYTDDSYAGSFSARYSNNPICARVWILTSTKYLVESFFYMKARGDAIDQYLRRFIVEATVFKGRNDTIAKLGLDHTNYVGIVERVEYPERREVDVPSYRYDNNTEGPHDKTKVMSSFDFPEESMVYYEREDSLRILLAMVSEKNGRPQGIPAETKSVSVSQACFVKCPIVSFTLNEDLALWYWLRGVRFEEPVELADNPFSGSEGDYERAIGSLGSKSSSMEVKRRLSAKVFRLIRNVQDELKRAIKERYGVDVLVEILCEPNFVIGSLFGFRGGVCEQSIDMTDLLWDMDPITPNREVASKNGALLLESPNNAFSLHEPSNE